LQDDIHNELQDDESFEARQTNAQSSNAFYIFARFVQTAQSGVLLAHKQGETVLAEKILARMALYEKTTFLSVRIMVINLVQLELSKKENNVKIVFYCERLLKLLF